VAEILEFSGGFGSLGHQKSNSFLVFQLLDV